MSLSQLPSGLTLNASSSLPLRVVRKAGLASSIADIDFGARRFIEAQTTTSGKQFGDDPGEVLLLPGNDGLGGALLAVGDDRSPFPFGAIPVALPSATTWRLVPGDYDLQSAVLGAALGAYRFDRFKPRKSSPALLAVPAGCDRAITIAEAVCYSRDLINTPANLLGPVELADAAVELAERFGARYQRVIGPELEVGYPALAAVGAGSDRPAQVVRLYWGEDPSKKLISICGKGVCFDSGGYDLKPSTSMLRMKKDMGGAAIALGLARAIMALSLDVRLEVRIGCVENSISGHAMRPLDVINSRAGKNIEIGNTDAEGRLVLADLLADASDAQPYWLIDFATLTGAARVALGPDLPALFSNNDAMARDLMAGGDRTTDPLWRLPLWRGYAPWLDSSIADLNTVTQKPYAGAIVAALFLKHFVPDHVAWGHIDTYAWNDQDRLGRPEGGESLGLRAVLEAIEVLGTKLQ